MNKKVSLLDDANIYSLSGASRFTHVIFLVVVVFIITAITWANYAILDEVTVGQGKVVPSREIQVIQNLEGGIVREILVKEGEIVSKNQVLMKIDDTRFSSSYKEAKQKIINLKLDIFRLMLEFDNKPFLLPKALEKQANPSLVKSKKLLHTIRLKEKEQLNEALRLAQKELTLLTPLVKNGAVSDVELIRAQRAVNDINGKILAFNSKSLTELTTAKAELDRLMEAYVADKDRLNRTTVRAPLKGIIKQINVNTIGGVVKPGMDLMEIVPLEDTLLIEAKIRPSDIGFIHPRQKAMVKISAYDYSIYGGLDAVVEHISADTIVDDKGDSFYIIKVRTNKNYLGSKDKPLAIIPGMQASVDILTGQKSVLNYILKPLIKARETALRER